MSPPETGDIRPTTGDGYRTAGGTTAKAIVKLRKITKTFYRGKEAVEVLRSLDLDVAEGRLAGFDAGDEISDMFKYFF